MNNTFNATTGDRVMIHDPESNHGTVLKASRNGNYLLIKTDASKQRIVHQTMVSVLVEPEMSIKNDRDVMLKFTSWWEKNVQEGDSESLTRAAFMAGFYRGYDQGYENGQ